MTPRTTSPPPTSYGSYDDFSDIDAQSLPFNQPVPLQRSQPEHEQFNPINTIQNQSTMSSPLARQDRSPTMLNRGRNNINNNSSIFTTLLLRPLNVPRRVITSSTVQAITLIVISSFCITTLWCIFCASYVLTFYDDTKRMVRTSHAWARLKNGVRERLSMMGEDWEELGKKYFDQPTNLDASGKNSHLGGAGNIPPHMNNNGGSARGANMSGSEWEEWMKGIMFRFVTAVAGQDTTNRFQQSAPFRFRPSSATPPNSANDGGKR